ncbi:cytochrome P450 1A4-like isoform X1 [Rhipicephalus microplus]|uniref:cytochrome P450 1A4-like isoform X1 n=2 Tax=Rhipicephalus microplus TaxID=6941 RepID=UPI003F6D53F8
MTLLAVIASWDWRLLTTTVVFLVTYYVVRFYHKVSQYPKGPFPLPIVGNLLTLAKEKELHKKATEWSKYYGDPFTLWMGSRPMIVLNSYEVIKEGLVEKRHDFAGRFATKLGDIQIRDDHDIVFEDYNATWKALRKVAVTAVRKYAVSESLENLCTEIVDAYVDSLDDEPLTVDARVPIMSIIINVLSVSAFSAKFDAKSPDLNRMMTINRTFTELAPNGLPSDIAPWLGILYRAREKRCEDLFAEIRSIVRRMYAGAIETYQPGKVLNFTHAILSARDEALEQEKNDAEFLTEGNMIQILIDLFGAGTDTSIGELQWLLLKISREPSIQDKIRKEIDDNIGQSPPTMQDIERLPYTMACIMETLRCYPIAPFGLPHKASHDSVIAGIPIPKDTRLMYNAYSVNHDPKLWVDHDVFRPERFLNPVTGTLLSKDRLPPLLSFGLGPRSCLGEKLAKADMFYVIVRLVQRLSISAPEGETGREVVPMGNSFFLFAGRQNVVLTKNC